MTAKSRPKTTAKSKAGRTLTRQLETTPADSSVGAVFTLRTSGTEAYMSAASTREAVEKIVAEASEGAQAQPERVTVFPNVQSFAVYGPPALMRKLAEHTGVAAATANKPDEEVLIRPVKRGASRKTPGKKR